MNGDSGAAAAATLERAARQRELEWEDPPRRVARAASPVLAVDGFEGPLDWLLEMARAKRIDLARLSIAALIEAFARAMEAALSRAPDAAAPDLVRWAGWTVMAAQLTELRSRLLLPPTPRRPGRPKPRPRRSALHGCAARRPPLRRTGSSGGRSSASRCSPGDGRRRSPAESRSTSASSFGETTADGEREAGDEPEKGDASARDAEDDSSASGGDLTDLLRACLVALRLPPGATAWQPPRLPFWSVRDAAKRIARLADGRPEGTALAAFLPEIPAAGANRSLRCRVALSATFVVALELTRGGALTLEQELYCEPVRVRRRERVLQGRDAETPAQT